MCDGDHDPDHRRSFEFPPDFIPSVQHSRNVIARWEQQRLEGRRFPFAVRDAITNELLGGCELQPLDDHAANMSYWTYRPHRRGGVASQAVARIRTIAFEEFGFRRLEIFVDPDDIGSRRVAVRSGFTLVGARSRPVCHQQRRATGEVST